MSFPATRLARMALRNLGSALQAAGSRGRSGKGRQSGNKRRRRDKEKKRVRENAGRRGRTVTGVDAKRFSFGFVPDPREVGHSQRGPPPQRVTSGFGRPGLFVLLGACFLGI